MGYPRCWMEVMDAEKNEAAAVDWKDIINLSIELSLYTAADTFNCTLRNDRLISEYLQKKQEVSFWLGTVNNPSNWSKEELTHVFTGQIDGIRPYFGEQMTLQLIGRDYAAKLIDAEFSVAYAEYTASQIAALIAKEQGLAPDVVPTDIIIERDLYKDRKQWEILQELADREGYVCYVKKNKTLYFGPRQDYDNAKVCDLNYRQKEKSNTVSIQFDDSMVGIINQVVVRHWQGETKTLIEGEAKNDENIRNYGSKKRVYYDPKAATKEIAGEIAAKKLKDLLGGIVTAEQIKVPLSPAMDTEKMVGVKGCGRFDGNYYIEQVQHSFSKSGGAFTEIKIAAERPDSAEQYRKSIYPEKTGEENESA
jgi:phage protein D